MSSMQAPFARGTLEDVHSHGYPMHEALLYLCIRTLSTDAAVTSFCGVTAHLYEGEAGMAKICTALCKFIATLNVDQLVGSL
jgi:hypothetical protein